MRATRILLLIIGLLGVAASIYGLIQGQSFFDQLITLVCSAALIYGYFFYKNEEKKQQN